MKETDSITYQIDDGIMHPKTCIVYDANKILILGEDNKPTTLKDYISQIVIDTINNKDRHNG